VKAVVFVNQWIRPHRSTRKTGPFRPTQRREVKLRGELAGTGYLGKIAGWPNRRRRSTSPRRWRAR